MVAIYFGLDYMDFRRFSLETTSLSNNMIRLIVSILMQVTLSSELEKTTKLMAWLK